MFGLALKFLVDGRASVDTVALYDAHGQGNNTNYFYRKFQTTMASAKNLITSVIEKTRNQFEYPARSIPVRDLTKFTPDGKVVADFVYPYMLEFRPHARVANLMADDSKMETRAELQQKLTPGPIFDVYAASALDDPNAFHIGQVVLKSEVVPSEFGDKKLCFKHQRNKPVKDEF